MSLAVIDVGKTHTRIVVFDDGNEVASVRTQSKTYRDRHGTWLDTAHLEHWVETTLKSLNLHVPIDQIIPVTHGAAFAQVASDGKLLAPVLDYEFDIPTPVREAYSLKRSPFEETGSPELPLGLNMGLQIAYLESIGRLHKEAILVPYAQYWSARLSGKLTSEMSSLGCHTDLWSPRDKSWSSLSKARGWDTKFAPIIGAGEEIGAIAAPFAGRIGLSRQTKIYNGLHDSNGALVAMKGYLQNLDRRLFLSTGTWHVLFAPDDPTEPLRPDIDALLNVDVEGHSVLSLRTMGGRDAETICNGAVTAPTIAALQHCIDHAQMVLPPLTASGPFVSRQVKQVETVRHEASAALSCLYTCLVWKTMISLLPTQSETGDFLLEGPAATQENAAVLAALCPTLSVYLCDQPISPAVGAAVLLRQGQKSEPELKRVQPAPLQGLSEYAARWLDRAGGAP